MKLNERRIPLTKDQKETDLLKTILAGIENEINAFSPATAVLCYNELIGFALFEACKRKSIRIPEDLSVIGFDDINADLAIPPMTVVSSMLHETGRQAALQAIDMINDTALQKRMKGKRTEIPAGLVVRGSTGPAPDRAAF